MPPPMFTQIKFGVPPSLFRGGAEPNMVATVLSSNIRSRVFGQRGELLRKTMGVGRWESPAQADAGEASLATRYPARAARWTETCSRQWRCERPRLGDDRVATARGVAHRENALCQEGIRGELFSDALWQGKTCKCGVRRDYVAM